SYFEAGAASGGLGAMRAGPSIASDPNFRKANLKSALLLEFQQPLGIAVQQLLLVLRAQWQGLRPFGARRVVDKRIVDREENAVDPHFHHAAQEGGIGEEAARRNEEVLAECIPKALAAFAVSRQAHVDAPEIKRQALAEVAENDFQTGIGVEHAAQHQANALRCGLDREAPGGAQQRGILRYIVFVIGLDYRRMGDRGMHVERHVERLRALENRPELLVV